MNVIYIKIFFLFILFISRQNVTSVHRSNPVYMHQLMFCMLKRLYIFFYFKIQLDFRFRFLFVFNSFGIERVDKILRIPNSQANETAD